MPIFPGPCCEVFTNLNIIRPSSKKQLRRCSTFTTAQAKNTHQMPLSGRATKTQTQNATKHKETCITSKYNAIVRKSITKHSHKSVHSSKHKDTYITSNDNAIFRKGQGSCEATCSSEDPDIKHLKSFFCNLHVLPATNYQLM